MKNYFRFLTVGIIAASAFSCTKAPVEEAPKANEFEQMVINAGFSSEKTQLSDETSGNVNWSTGDALSAFSTSATTSGNNKLTGSNYSGGSANFSGQIELGTTSFVLLYPYASANSYSDGTISTVLPATQTATKASFANGVAIAMGKGTRTPGVAKSGDVVLENLCAVLKFTLPSNITFANKITVSSKSSTPMAGNVSINAGTGAMTASSASVVMTGTFEGGNNYYITVAPGTYTNGFNFVIETASGDKYVRETTKSVPAQAGVIYPLGTLSLGGLEASQFTSSMAITHNVASNTLNGSTAKFSMGVKNTSEFGGIITKYKVDVTLKKGGTTYRTLSYEGASVQNVAMAVSGVLDYLPSGSDYSYTASVKYYVNTGSATVERGPVALSGTATSPKPSGFAIDANISGYTSYDYYTGGNVSAANGCDGSTIYGIGASYKSGLSTRVYEQCSSLLSISSTLDNSAVSGDKGGQSWAGHTIRANWSFDGASGTCATTKTVQVTGLPYNTGLANFYTMQNDWSKSGGKNTITDNNYLRYGNGCTVTFKGFNVPANIKASVSYKIYCYGAVYTEGARCKCVWNIAGTQIFSESFKGTGKTVQHIETKTVTFTTSNKTMYTKDDSRASTWGDSHSQLFYMGASYSN